MRTAWIVGARTRSESSAVSKLIRCLDEETRALLRPSPGVLAKELGLASRSGSDRHIEALVAEGRQAVEAATTFRDFVKSFRDGKIKLKEFLQGPPQVSHDCADVDLDAVLDALLSGFVGSPRGRKSTRRARGRR
jgi:hypothetical protein